MLRAASPKTPENANLPTVFMTASPSSQIAATEGRDSQPNQCCVDHHRQWIRREFAAAHPRDVRNRLEVEQPLVPIRITMSRTAVLSPTSLLMPCMMLSMSMPYRRKLTAHSQ
jgi:hypothetical protein